MQLVNQTQVPAKLVVSHVADGELRAGILTAKASFQFAEGKTELDTQSPRAIEHGRTQSELGELPADFMLRSDDRFEVMLLGCAHAPEGEQIRQQRVALSVGEVRRELMVFGDRAWTTASGQPLISDPALFDRMPLTWERAFGGSCQLEIDEGSFIELRDPSNPAGRGFDVEPMVRAQAEHLEPPPGFPRHHYQRLLPNVEHPDALITSPDGAPEPACWAPIPINSALRLRSLREREVTTFGTPEPKLMAEVLRDASPEWVIDLPEAGAPVLLEGLCAAQQCAFPLPQLRVMADYVIGPRRGGIELRPQTLVLLVEEQRFYIVYRAVFRVDYKPDEERSMRLRLQQGWVR